MRQNRAYWLLQAAGWGVYIFSELVGYYFYYFLANLTRPSASSLGSLLANGLVNFLAGILLTHSFRLIFKRFDWIHLPIPQLLFRCLLAIILITVTMTAINIPLDQQLISTDRANWALTDAMYIINFGKPIIIWVLIYVFYSYSNERKKDLIERLRLESSVRETESKVLRAQMNPHFMFNALNSIRALILEDPARAQQGVTQLSNILRSSLIADRRTTVTLKEELKTIEDYLALEKVRYEERLQLTWAIDDKTLGAQVPPMMLQTLVENAIKHGVQKAIRWGFVEVATFFRNHKLVIRIRNTGQLVSDTEHSESSGFGLQNTQQRLHLLYGAAASFRIFQEDELIVCAEIEIPV